MSKKLKTVGQLCLVIGSLGGLLSETAQADSLMDETLAELSRDAGRRFPNGVFLEQPQKTADNNGIKVNWVWPKRVLAQASEQKKAQFRKQMDQDISRKMCASSADKTAKKLAEYFATGHYVDLSFSDPEIRDGIVVRIDQAHCEAFLAMSMGQSGTTSKAYLEDDYLNDVVLPPERKSLPKELVNGVELYKIQAQNHVITYYSRPSNEVKAFGHQLMLIEQPSMVHDVLAQQFCQDPKERQLLKKIKSIDYVYNRLPKVVISISAEDCR